MKARAILWQARLACYRQQRWPVVALALCIAAGAPLAGLWLAVQTRHAEQVGLADARVARQWQAVLKRSDALSRQRQVSLVMRHDRLLTLLNDQVSGPLQVRNEDSRRVDLGVGGGYPQIRALLLAVRGVPCAQLLHLSLQRNDGQGDAVNATIKVDLGDKICRAD
jgi:hypothetical protein